MTTPPKTMAEIRDAEALEAHKEINSSLMVKWEFIEAFKAGFDCRDKLDNEALKIAVEILKMHDCHKGSSYFDGEDKTIAVCNTCNALAEIRKLNGDKK